MIGWELSKLAIMLKYYYINYQYKLEQNLRMVDDAVDGIMGGVWQGIEALLRGIITLI